MWVSISFFHSGIFYNEEFWFHDQNKMLFKKEFTNLQMFKPYISNLYLPTDKTFVN